MLFASIILLIVALPAVLASTGPVPPSTGQATLPAPGEPPADISHSHQQQQDGGAPSTQAPPPPRDVHAYLPLLSRPNACDLNEEEQAIATLATGHPEQERETMSCHPIVRYS